MFFKNRSEKISVHDFDNYRKNICIYRGVGGLGDILAMRMIFEDLKKNYPEFQITWAVPYRFFFGALQHPFIDHVEVLYQWQSCNLLFLLRIKLDLISSHKAQEHQVLQVPI